VELKQAKIGIGQRSAAIFQSSHSGIETH